MCLAIPWLQRISDLYFDLIRVEPVTPPTESRERSRSIKERQEALEEHLTQSTEDGGSQRSEILSRISKMGQPMLPMSSSGIGIEEEVKMAAATQSDPTYIQAPSNPQPSQPQMVGGALQGQQQQQVFTQPISSQVRKLTVQDP